MSREIKDMLTAMEMEMYHRGVADGAKLIAKSLQAALPSDHFIKVSDVVGLIEGFTETPELLENK